MGVLLSAPDEIIIQILLLVPGKNIQRCRRICRHFHELVDSTAQLQYLIELIHLRYVEPAHPRHDLTYHQKAKLLREHRLRGASPSHTFTLDTTLPSELEETEAQNYAALCDGVYVEGFGPRIDVSIRRLEFYRLPSWNRGTELKKWVLQLRVEAVHIDLNLDLNLLCLVEIQNTGHDNPAAFDVHLRTLGSDGVHPGAALSKLSWGANQGSSSHVSAWRMSSHILGDLLGILCTHQSSTANYLIVWDWPSGLKLLHLHNTGQAPGSFTIIDNKYVVSHRPVGLVGKDLFVGYLDVYQLNRLNKHPPPTVTLSLPLFESYSGSNRTYFHASPLSSIAFARLDNNRHQPYPKLYEVGVDTDHLCLVRCSIRNYHSAIGWLAIPSSTILDVVKKCEADGLPGTTMVSWELWGDRTSWVYHADPILHPPSATLCSGLRTIAGTQTDGPTIIWDFDSRTIQSSGRSTGSEHELTPRVCFPKEIGPASWDQRYNTASLPSQLAGNIFFGDEPLANQPFCTSRLARKGDSGPTMMQGEHSTYGPRKTG
ncbi:hypothetical protein FRC12_011054 [Ceratobasidium sp. 428]|nr:hypothetical protein FRC12_011054 [Ceratobasidium sp. 428]